MNRLIKACEVMDFNLIKVQYNQFDDGPEEDGNDMTSKSSVVSKFVIDGMTCKACVATIGGAIKKLPGVEAVSISLALARASVMHDRELTSASSILQTIEDKGYQARLGERNAQQNLEAVQQVSQLQSLRKAFEQATTLASAIIIIDWLDHWNLLSRIFRELCVVSIGSWVQLIVAWPIHHKAWNSGLLSSPSMDTLISLSLLIGMCLSIWTILFFGESERTGYFSSGAFLTSVIIGGRYLDTLLKRQSAASLAQLYTLQSETHLVRLRHRSGIGHQKRIRSIPNEECQQRIPALSLEPGDEIFVGPGTIIPCDCYVTSGSGLVDQSIMTGESLPAIKGPGDFLMSGTRNLSSELAAIVSKRYAESALEQLISSISVATEDELNDGSSDFLTSSFVKIILLLALCTAIATYALKDQDICAASKLRAAGERAMAVLASACPCALGLASPSAVMSGVSTALSRGVVVRGGARTIDKIASLTHMVMDKTGTLTTGELSVSHINGLLKPEHCMLICAAERQRALVHPVARTVFKWALSQLCEQDRSLQNALETVELENTLSTGVACKVYCQEKGSIASGCEVHIGNAAFLQEWGIMPSSCQRSELGHGIIVYVAVDRQHIASIFLQDTIRQETQQVIEALKFQSGLCIKMLTGDNEIEAQRVAQTLGIPVLSSQALPTQKRSIVEGMKAKREAQTIAMVGDGLNDASAISGADVGIFISPGLSLSNLACAEVANVIVTSSDLTALVDLLFIAKATMKQIRWNTRWAIAYNIMAVALAAGALEPWGLRIDASMAGTLMAFSSISILAWSLWFRKELTNKRLFTS